MMNKEEDGSYVLVELTIRPFHRAQILYMGKDFILQKQTVTDQQWSVVEKTNSYRQAVMYLVIYLLQVVASGIFDESN